VHGAEPEEFNLLLLGIPASGINYYLVLNDGSKQIMDAVLGAAIEFWRVELKAKNLPSPFT
jgi:hypothetical protein